MLERDQSFLARLLAKLSFTIQVGEQTGKPTNAAQKEVWRQIDQTSPQRGGDPITGRGVTKSGNED
jgi:hypothetical protein